MTKMNNKIFGAPILIVLKVLFEMQQHKESPGLFCKGDKWLENNMELLLIGEINVPILGHTYFFVLKLV